jgi:hypothetical protein
MPMLATEHILLESDVREIPEASAARKEHASLRLRSRLRRRAIALKIIDYYFLAVRTRRGGAAPGDYVLDLRFVDPKPRTSRHVAWRWFTATMSWAALFAASIWWLSASQVPWWENDALPIAGALFAAMLVSGFVCMYRSTETLWLISLHGRVPVLEIVGNLGTFSHIRKFIVKLAAHVQIAVAARRPNRAEHLRDEMREHSRLKELGVLSTEQYDEAKRLILGQHGEAVSTGLRRSRSA